MLKKKNIHLMTRNFKRRNLALFNAAKKKKITSVKLTLRPKIILLGIFLNFILPCLSLNEHCD